MSYPTLHSTSTSSTTHSMEDSNISRKTWSRDIESVIKIGYRDGAADGQAAVFQSSFDMGYKQGFSLGIELGSRYAMLSLQQQGNVIGQNVSDPRRINCQLCITGIPAEQNVVNLYNTQQEKNTEILKQKQQIEND